MKKYLLIIAISCFACAANAQFLTNLVVSNTPPATLTQWAGKKEVLTYIVNLQGSAGAQAKIKTEIKLTDGTPVAVTDLAKAPVYSFVTATTIFSAAEVIPLDNMIFNGRFKTALEKTGKLLSENYQICVQLVTPTDFIPRSEQKCRNFFIASLQLPIPILPNETVPLETTKSQTNITFRWTPVSPTQLTPPHYRIQVFEVQEDQRPMQAFRANQPILDKEVVGATQYNWNPQMAFLPCCKEGDNDGDGGYSKLPGADSTVKNDAYIFIWTLQTLDASGHPLGDGNINGDGRSEPIMFYIDRRPMKMRAALPTRILFLNNMLGKKP